jgi:hypothetical protein
MKHFMKVRHIIWSWFKFQFIATNNFTYKQNMRKTFEWSKTWFKWFSFLGQISMLKAKLFKLKFWPTIQTFKIKIWERYLTGNKMFHGLSFRKRKQNYYIQKNKKCKWVALFWFIKMIDFEKIITCTYVWNTYLINVDWKVKK